MPEHEHAHGQGHAHSHGRPPDAAGPPAVVGHETTDVNARLVVWFVIGLTVAGVLIHLGLLWLYDVYAEREAAQKDRLHPLAGRTDQLRLPPPPVLEGFDPGHQVGSDSPETAARQRAQEEARLHRYGWADEKARVVRIPIEEAMAGLERDLASRRPAGRPAGVDERPPERPRASSSGRTPPRGGEAR
jgi:hypothetical protein